MGWPSTLTYAQVAATGIRRSLTIPAAYGDLETATKLLAGNSSLADDPEGLAEAAENGHESVVRLMLHYRPRLAERIAVVARTPELTEYLFQNGMNPNLVAWLGVTPLHRFAQRGDIEKAAVFLAHGADLHARDEEYCTTPLGYAVLARKLRMVEFLLRRGAKVCLPDDLEWASPIALAAIRGHDEILRMLKAYEATGEATPYDLKSMESLVNDIVVAYQYGEADAFLRVIDHFSIRRQIAWDRPDTATRVSRLRRFVLHRLAAAKRLVESETLGVSEAQLLVARSYGFGSWRELEAEAARVPGADDV
jgi:hypothetical protein